MGLQPDTGDKTFHAMIEPTLNARVQVTPSMFPDEAYEAYEATAANRQAAFVLFFFSCFSVAIDCKFYDSHSSNTAHGSSAPSSTSRAR